MLLGPTFGLHLKTGAQCLLLQGPVFPGMDEALALAGRVGVDRNDNAC